jgi:hypothetical protein
MIVSRCLEFYIIRDLKGVLQWGWRCDLQCFAIICHFQPAKSAAALSYQENSSH